MEQSTFGNPTFGKIDLDVFRALVREVLGDKAPKQWHGVAQADDMARKLPHDLSAAQAAAVHALVACEAIYSASQLDEMDAGTQAIYDSGTAHARAADALDRLSDLLPIQHAVACNRIARSLLPHGQQDHSSNEQAGTIETKSTELPELHSIVTGHGDICTPSIEAAQARCKNPQNVNEVWVELCSMAKIKKPPLLGTTEEGIQYEDSFGDTKYLSKSSLKKRLSRQAAKRR